MRAVRSLRLRISRAGKRDRTNIVAHTTLSACRECSTRGHSRRSHGFRGRLCRDGESAGKSHRAHKWFVAFGRNARERAKSIFVPDHRRPDTSGERSTAAPDAISRLASSLSQCVGIWRIHQESDVAVANALNALRFSAVSCFSCARLTSALAKFVGCPHEDTNRLRMVRGRSSHYHFPISLSPHLPLAPLPT